jgi:hypothetical protein
MEKIFQSMSTYFGETCGKHIHLIAVHLFTLLIIKINKYESVKVMFYAAYNLMPILKITNQQTQADK